MAQKQTPLQMTTGSLFDSPLASTERAGASAFDGAGGEVVVKRASVWAVLSAVVAVPSLLAFMNLNFLGFSIAALAMALVAFWLIYRSGGELSGTSVAGFGLALSLATLIGGPFNARVYRVSFDKQAEEFAQYWFETVKSDNIALTRQLQDPYWRRVLFVTHDDVVSFWIRAMGNEEEPHASMHGFLANPTLLTINKLGDRAKMTHYKTVSDFITSDKESTSRIYAITIEPEKPGEKKQTFFINLLMERVKAKTEEEGTLHGWTVVFNEYEALPLDEEGRPYVKSK